MIKKSSSLAVRNKDKGHIILLTKLNNIRIFDRTACGKDRVDPGFDQSFRPVRKREEAVTVGNALFNIMACPLRTHQGKLCRPHSVLLAHTVADQRAAFY